jgi:hypothetical protein
MSFSWVVRMVFELIRKDASLSMDEIRKELSVLLGLMVRLLWTPATFQISHFVVIIWHKSKGAPYIKPKD